MKLPLMLAERFDNAIPVHGSHCARFSLPPQCQQTKKGPAVSRSPFVEQFNLAEQKNAFRGRRLFSILNHRTIEKLVVLQIDLEERRPLRNAAGNQRL